MRETGAPPTQWWPALHRGLQRLWGLGRGPFLGEAGSAPQDFPGSSVQTPGALGNWLLQMTCVSRDRCCYLLHPLPKSSQGRVTGMRPTEGLQVLTASSR